MTKRKERNVSSEISINDGVINTVGYWLKNAQNYYKKNDLNNALTSFSAAKKEANGHYIPITYEWTINYGLSTIYFMQGRTNEAEKYAKRAIKAANTNKFDNVYTRVLPLCDLLLKIYNQLEDQEQVLQISHYKIQFLKQFNQFIENNLQNPNLQKEINKNIICMQDNNVEIYNTYQSLINNNWGAEQSNKDDQFQISFKTQNFIQKQLKLAIDSKYKAELLLENEILEYNEIITEYQKSLIYLNQISTNATQQFQPDKLNEIANLKQEISNKIKEVERQKNFSDKYLSDLNFSDDIEALLNDSDIDNWCKDLYSGSGDNLSGEENPLDHEHPFDTIW